jgi:nitrogen fixation protein NifU and related proteins
MKENHRETTDIQDIHNNFEYLGKMDDPTAYGKIKGICGDELEFYIKVENDIIKSVKFLTSGCYFTKSCGEAVAREAEGKKVFDALEINPKQVLSLMKGLPVNHTHCTILAVSSLYKTIANYLWQKH